jgi:hypothetical protein
MKLKSAFLVFGIICACSAEVTICIKSIPKAVVKTTEETQGGSESHPPEPEKNNDTKTDEANWNLEVTIDENTKCEIPKSSLESFLTYLPSTELNIVLSGKIVKAITNEQIRAVSECKVEGGLNIGRILYGENEIAKEAGESKSNSVFSLPVMNYFYDCKNQANDLKKEILLI